MNPKGGRAWDLPHFSTNISPLPPSCGLFRLGLGAQGSEFLLSASLGWVSSLCGVALNCEEL